MLKDVLLLKQPRIVMKIDSILKLFLNLFLRIQLIAGKQIF